MKDIAKEALRKTQLFGNLSDEHLSRLASLTGIERRKQGETVFSQGDQGDKFYLILEGQIRISREIAGMGEEALAILKQGNHFGEMSLIDNQTRSADAKVHENATLLTLAKRDLEDLLFVDREVACDVLWEFVRTLCTRLRETDDKLTFLSVSSKFE
jgi:CRP-like cAMP-binding protein